MDTFFNNDGIYSILNLPETTSTTISIANLDSQCGNLLESPAVILERLGVKSRDFEYYA